MNEIYQSPWSTSLVMSTCLTLAFLAALCAIGSKSSNSLNRIILLLLPICLSICAILFTVRGYVVEDHEIVIQRLLWSNKIDISSITSVVADPSALAESTRLFANGGFFGFVGLYYNPNYGRFLAFATDASKSIIISSSDKVFLVTPDNPNDFMDQLMKRKIP
jgi:Bacterial PH domain